METKRWFKSKGILGNAGGIGAFLAVIINLVAGDGSVTGEEITAIIVAIAGVISNVVGLYGRIVANTQVTK